MCDAIPNKCGDGIIEKPTFEPSLYEIYEASKQSKCVLFSL